MKPHTPSVPEHRPLIEGGSMPHENHIFAHETPRYREWLNEVDTMGAHFLRTRVKLILDALWATGDGNEESPRDIDPNVERTHYAIYPRDIDPNVERTHYAIYATQTGKTIAETPHPWAASLIAQALNTAALEVGLDGRPGLTPTPDEDQYIGTPEAAALEGVTSETIRRWCETGELAGSKTAPGRSSRWKTTRRFLRERRERLERMKA